MPSDYEIVGSQLAYHHKLGSAVRTPARNFYEKYACDWAVPDWETLRDPAATTYDSYVTSRRDRELFAEQLLRTCDSGAYDAALPAPWLDVLDTVLGPLRFPCHGLQLMAAYLAQAAPSGRLTVMLGFQAADELRRITRFAYRTKQLMLAHPTFAADAKQQWLDAAAWQPLRQLIEELLTTYPFTEAFCALQLVLKPQFDALFGVQFANISLMQRDDVLGRLLLSLHEDSVWHHEVGSATARFAAEHGHAPALQQHIQTWQPRVRAALLAAAQGFRPVARATPATPATMTNGDDLAKHLDEAHTRSLQRAGLDTVPANSAPLGTGANHDPR
jgi:toluene monooxygenase system protein E